MERLDDLARRLDEVESRTRLGELVATYCHGLDQRDIDVFLGVFHPDATWSVPDVFCARGHDEIAATVKDVWTARPATWHWATNFVVDLRGDTATGTVDVSAVMEELDGTRTRAAATYRDVYERRHGQWRIVERIVAMHFVEPGAPRG